MDLDDETFADNVMKLLKRFKRVVILTRNPVLESKDLSSEAARRSLFSTLMAGNATSGRSFSIWPMACSFRPHMDPLTAAAASGLQARMDSLDLLANNLSNTSTSGYKADREFYSTYLSAAAAEGSDPAVGDEAVVERHWTDFSQGSLVSTGSSTDLALTGAGFFAVTTPNGTLYTRNGSFQISPQGTLTTAEGYPVRAAGGQLVQLQQGFPLEVSADGQLAQNGTPLGQLELVDFKDPSQLTKAAGTYFKSPDPKTVKPVATTTAQVAQAKLESSNAQPAESAARLVMLMRHFEMLQRAVKIGADMNKQAVEEVARVGS
jgi:flagellar basal-body rod protein FlgF